MGFLIQVAELGSRAIRSEVTKDGLRTISTGLIQIAKGEGNQEVIESILGAVGSLFSSLLKGAIELLQGIQITWSAIWGVVSSAATYIYNFDFNQSDEQLDKTAYLRFQAVIPRVGTFLGRTLGYLACGALPGTAIFVFNEALGSQILLDLGEQYLAEIIPELEGIIVATFNGLLYEAGISIFKNLRNVYKGINSDEEEEAFNKKLKAAGLNRQKIRQVLDDRKKPWVIAQQVQHQVDKISNTALKILAETTLQQFGQSCIEVGYVVAGSVDAFIAAQKQQEQLAAQGNAALVSFAGNTPSAQLINSQKQIVPSNTQPTP